MRLSKKHAPARAKPAPPTPTPSEPKPTAAPAAPAPFEPAEELIAARAYEKWQQRGCPMGQDSARDWYAAREELLRETAPSSPKRAG